MGMRADIEHSSLKERHWFSVSSFHSEIERGFSLEKEWGN